MRRRQTGVCLFNGGGTEPSLYRLFCSKKSRRLKYNSQFPHQDANTRMTVAFARMNTRQYENKYILYILCSLCCCALKLRIKSQIISDAFYAARVSRCHRYVVSFVQQQTTTGGIAIKV